MPQSRWCQVEPGEVGQAAGSDGRGELSGLLWSDQPALLEATTCQALTRSQSHRQEGETISKNARDQRALGEKGVKTVFLKRKMQLTSTRHNSLSVGRVTSRAHLGFQRLGLVVLPPGGCLLSGGQACLRLHLKEQKPHQVNQSMEDSCMKGASLCEAWNTGPHGVNSHPAWVLECDRPTGRAREQESENCPDPPSLSQSPSSSFAVTGIFCSSGKQASSRAGPRPTTALLISQHLYPVQERNPFWATHTEKEECDLSNGQAGPSRLLFHRYQL